MATESSASRHRQPLLISQDGKVMTAAHVVHAMDEIRVELPETSRPVALMTTTAGLTLRKVSPTMALALPWAVAAQPISHF